MFQQHLEFAAQLETFGMWHWSLFVLLHLKDSHHRKSSIKDVLCRHIRLWDNDSVEREDFLVEKLKIPIQWIAEAQALSAATAGNRGDQVWPYLKVILYL
jgi:nuclear pore complex protein Nup98-Nup96